MIQPLSAPEAVEAKTNIGDLPDVPKFSIKTVCGEVGIRPVTLRAWERRYQLLVPHRTRSNYRLYSERDVAILHWLKSRVDSGQSISTAAGELLDLRRAGLWPAIVATPQAPITRLPGSAPDGYATRLYEVLLRHDEQSANLIINDVIGQYDIVAVCNDVITPCLHKIGDAWSAGRIRIATEHFASSYLRGRLMTYYQQMPHGRLHSRIIIGCAPGELHEIPALILSIFLRREGYRVEYLGQDVNVDDLLDYTRIERPAMVILTANSLQSAHELQRVHVGLNAMRPKPKFGFGGRACIISPSLRESVPGVYLGDTLSAGVTRVRQLLGA
ncbi:MAG: cobalamin-dependent protein [Anaerolineales bacterium]|nr:cobalamin-dependent protein [Anaerolineales bacterium]